MIDYRNKIYHENCFDVMRRMPDSCVDLVLCDLPYGITANPWDTVIDLEAFWLQVWRIAKPEANVVLSASGSFVGVLMASALEYYKYKVVWKKNRPSGHLQAGFMFMKCHEDFLIFRKTGKGTFNPQKTAAPTIFKTHNSPKGRVSSTYGKEPKITGNRFYADRNPQDIIEFDVVERSDYKHPTQKPVALGRYLVRTYTNPGDLVFDPTTGHGSFLLAALEERRDYVGCETELGYSEVSAARLGKKKPDKLPKTKKVTLS